MIKFTKIPATPGSLETTPDLEGLINSASKEELKERAINIGGTILVNVKPPTPARVIEVMDQLLYDHPSIDIDLDRRVLFLTSVLQGAIEVEQRANLAGSTS